MIHIVTCDNFAAIDSRLEAAYRRRSRIEGSSCPYFDALNEDGLILAILDHRRRCREGRDWLSSLRREMDALASTSPRAGARRQRSLIRANAERPGVPLKRGKRTKP
jgi:hypothetical protein